MNADDTRISLITVNYNGGSVFPRAVRNWLAHISEKDEVIICDNASTDASLASLPEDPRLKVIRNAENAGFARENGCTLSTRTFLSIRICRFATGK